ncbi:MAG: GNAT family N-acetyltransferase [Lachnospiraceae bacterium]|nr:GNAT family N-acetyltransferase [Lachnospiraceae bacterium]
MDFRIEKASPSDAEAIAAVIQTCYETLKQKEWYIPDNADYIRDLLAPPQTYDETGNPVPQNSALPAPPQAYDETGNPVPQDSALPAPPQTYEETLPGKGLHGIAYKAISMDNGELAGIFTVAFPGDGPKSMGYDIGFCPEQCRQLAHMDSAAVLPQFRGFQLQYRLMAAAEEELRRMGFRYLAATVHPDNHASKGTMLRLGYLVMATKEKYNGNLRHIMLKAL